MRSCITTLLSILATLSSAADIFDTHQPRTLAPRASPPPIGQCIERYTNYYYASYNYVFFNDPSEPQFHFTILTNYLEFYPGTLATWLRERKFTVLNTTHATATDDDLCGWRFYESVVVDDRRHGQVGWKHNYIRPNIDMPVTGNSSSIKAIPRQHIPHDSPIRPRFETIERIQTILRDNIPYADIYYFRCSMLGMACGMMGFALVWYGLVGIVEIRRKDCELKAAKESEDIELDQIRVHDLSGAGMQRMDTDGYHRHVDGTKFGIEMITPSAANSATSSVSSSIADPPPIYTLEGAGRSLVKGRDMV